jgi:hypothetical protein
VRGRRSARQRDTSEAASVELGGARTNDVIWLLKAKGQAVEAQVLLRQLDVLLLHVRHTRQAGSVGCGYNCCISMSPAPVPPIAARQLDLRTAAAASQQPPPRRMPPTTTRPNRTTAELPSTSTRRQPQHSSRTTQPLHTSLYVQPQKQSVRHNHFHEPIFQAVHDSCRFWGNDARPSWVVMHQI